MGPGQSCRKGTGHAGHGSAEIKEPLQVSKVITDIIRDTQALYGASHGKSSAAAQIFGPCRSLVTTDCLLRSHLKVQDMKLSYHLFCLKASTRGTSSEKHVIVWKFKPACLVFYFFETASENEGSLNFRMSSPGSAASSTEQRLREQRPDLQQVTNSNQFLVS